MSSEETRERVRCPYCHKLNTIWLHEDEKSADHKCRRCRLPLQAKEHRKWKSVDPDAYIHPLDRQALQALRKIPGVDVVLKKLIGLTYERMYRVAFKANSVRVSKDQYAHLDAKLEVVCQTLGMKKPELYVSVTNMGGVAVNAFTTGVEEPFIVIFAGLVERLTEQELLAILAHEMGHIHCEHLLYKAAADTLLMIMAGVIMRTPLASILGTIALPIQIALLMWRHKSELSCDRTALLVAQDERVVMSALTKISGGVLNDELSLDAFIAQAKEFDRAYEEDFLDKVWTLILAAQSSHPFPVWRISEILKWTEDNSPKGYPALLEQGAEIAVPVMPES